MPVMSAGQMAYLTVDKGWITEAAVEDSKLLPGVRIPMFPQAPFSDGLSWGWTLAGLTC